MPSCRLEIDLSAIDRNLGVVRSVLGSGEHSSTGSGSSARSSPSGPAGGVGVCAVLKQDGYGAGAVRVAKRIAGQVDMIAVYHLDEARALADAVPTVPILVLMPVNHLDRQDPLYRHAASGRIHLTLHSLEHLAAVNETAARLGAPIPVHVQVDTGMTRGGVQPDQAAEVVKGIVTSPKIRLGGLMTHFTAPCCDDQATREQARMFRDFVETIRPVIKAAVESGSKAVTRAHELSVHAANSCATFRSRSYHGTMVRVGQALLGYGLEDAPDDQPFEFRAQLNRLEPSVRLVSSVVHIQEIPAGWSVGYGSTWRAPARADGKKTRIGLVPVGYADGYPRQLSGRGNGGPGMVGLTGRIYDRKGSGGGEHEDDASPLPTVFAPVVGRVSMDQITVDLTDVPDAYLKPGKAGLELSGPEVELLGRKKTTPTYLPALAQAAGAITHELLCRVSPRVERLYKAPEKTEPKPTATTAGPGAAGAQIRMGGIGGAAAVAQ